MTMRIGQGYDAHRFADVEQVEDNSACQIVLGGVSIPHTKALLAHSDGDVLLHALTDALLGALALGDIGKHFPDTDPAFQNVDSRHLLRAALKLVSDQGFKPVNIDATIIAQSPKMATHIDSMRSNIAQDLAVDVNSVSVKATTTEKMGFTGREEGIAVTAVALLESV